MTIEDKNTIINLIDEVARHNRVAARANAKAESYPQIKNDMNNRAEMNMKKAEQKRQEIIDILERNTTQ